MSARRAYSHDGSDGAYSDDFISDEDRRTHSPYNKHRSYGGGGGGLGAHSRDRTEMTVTTADSDSRYWSSSFMVRAKGGGGGFTRGRGRGKARRGGRGNSRASEPITMKHDTVTKRVLSASRNRINELRNQVEEQKIIMKDLEAENKLFKKLQFRQEKAIKHFEDKENDLPRILDKHNNETRVLKEQNRRLREKFDRTDHYLRDAEDELERVRKRMTKYKDMCEQKELLERDELSRKVTKAEIDMEEKDVKIKELERHLEILKKNHRHELGIEMARQKELKRQIEEMTNKNNDYENQIKEKSKQLEYKNIYSQSINIAQQDNASNADQSPSRKMMKKRPSATDLTPRDKAKFYEEKRRVEVKKQKDVKAEQERKKRQKWEKEEQERLEREKEREKERSPRRSPVPVESPRHAPPAPEFNFLSIDKSLEERERDLSSRKRYREEQEEYRRQSERDRHDLLDKKKELERRQEEDRRKREEEDREQRQRENIDREDRDRRQREDRERLDKERREREERERREEEERQRKEKVERDRRENERVEQERRIHVEKEKLDNDPTLREERRKKDELLRRLQEMDKIGNNPAPKKDPETFHNNKDGNATGYDTPGSKKSDPKEYSFTNPVLNLHKGKPARDDVTVPYIQRQRQQRASKDDDEFGYTPSFGPGRGGGGVGGNKSSNTTTTTKPFSLFDDDDDDSPSTLKFDTTSTITNNNNKKTEKSSNLLENLFGPTSNSNSKTESSKISKGQDSETFFITSPTRDNTKKMNGTTTTTTNNTTSTAAFPWDNNSSSASPVKSNTNRSSSLFDRGGSSTIFGGGAAVVDDDLPTNSNRALPRRARQTNVSTFSAKPSVTAVDPFDDEIEEVVL